MRKRYRVLLIAAVVAALVVPVGYALSLESQPSTMIARTDLSQTTSATIVAAPVLMHQHAAPMVSDAATGQWSPFRSVPDAGKLFLVGTILFGLSAIVRKAV